MTLFETIVVWSIPVAIVALCSEIPSSVAEALGRYFLIFLVLVFIVVGMAYVFYNMGGGIPVRIIY